MGCPEPYRWICRAGGESRSRGGCRRPVHGISPAPGKSAIGLAELGPSLSDGQANAWLACYRRIRCFIRLEGSAWCPRFLTRGIVENLSPRIIRRCLMSRRFRDAISTSSHVWRSPPSARSRCDNALNCSAKSALEVTIGGVSPFCRQPICWFDRLRRWRPARTSLMSMANFCSGSQRPRPSL